MLIKHKLCRAYNNSNYIAIACNLKDIIGQLEGIIVPLVSEGFRMTLKIPMREFLEKIRNTFKLSRGFATNGTNLGRASQLANKRQNH